jgi:ubiquinone/menaquinone biosynthesis C-methylase UbiE
MITVLQEIPDRLKALKEVMRVLKPKGILAVTEFLPDPDYPLKKTTKRIVTSAGFSIDKENGDLWNYTIRFKVPG